ncbi:hypothetical protein RHMOL_Rhmol10G0139700 [Rhododendron molle]|uniref:Uncharacterized protein n=1 Tax=Rhododendron molle TaxID=49168 RepID=A0ACC0M363_RHOML|nr:hypothetical protein RHMOL_Rhmol10G0139700 [Rhododendron molle]
MWRKADHTDGPTTTVASELPIGSISKTLSRVLSPPVGYTDPVKIEGTKAKSPTETTSGWEVRDVGKTKKVGFQSLGQPSSLETNPTKWSQQNWVDMSGLIYPWGKRVPKSAHPWKHSAIEEVTRAIKEAQTNQATVELAQKVVEDKLVVAEKMLVEERKNIAVLKGQLEASKKASENALERNTQTILAL